MQMPIAAIAGAIIIVALAIWWVRLRMSGSGGTPPDTSGTIDSASVQDSDHSGHNHGFGDGGGGHGGGGH